LKVGERTMPAMVTTNKKYLLICVFQPIVTGHFTKS
jgi:hypothetical protein